MKKKNATFQCEIGIPQSFKSAGCRFFFIIIIVIDF